MTQLVDIVNKLRQACGGTVIAWRYHISGRQLILCAYESQYVRRYTHADFGSEDNANAAANLASSTLGAMKIS